MNRLSEPLPDSADSGALTSTRTVEQPALDTLVDGLVDDIRDLQDEVLYLHHTLTVRTSVEQAKGILMASFGLGADGASQLLVRWSSVCNVEPHAFARALIEVVEDDPGALWLRRPRVSPLRALPAGTP